jgi:ring-1,2-phenylacetyl-CoA epoxidase subunit PaaE
MSTHFHPLEVEDIIRETPEAVSIVFRLPEELKEEYAYKQGQYLTLRMPMPEGEVRRSYSMSSSPLEEKMTITVKKVTGGLMSTYLCEQMKVGDKMDIGLPEGRFFTPLHPENRKQYYLFAAGSGITPIMSILKTILEVEPLSRIYLLYGNRTEDSTIFKVQLEDLAKKYRDQFFVQFLLSSVENQPKKSFLSRFTSNKGDNGRINPTSIDTFFKEYPVEQQPEFFICGPGEMIVAAENHLKNKGFSNKQIHKEYFSTPGTAPVFSAPVKSTGSDSYSAIISLDGSVHHLHLPTNKTILEGLIQQKLDPPYSCTSGACSSCMAKLLSGEVKMDSCLALDESEIQAGYILTCQARVKSEEIEISYEV